MSFTKDQFLKALQAVQSGTAPRRMMMLKPRMTGSSMWPMSSSASAAWLDEVSNEVTQVSGRAGLQTFEVSGSKEYVDDVRAWIKEHNFGHILTEHRETFCTIEFFTKSQAMHFKLTFGGAA